jgi:hypothetical protein
MADFFKGLAGGFATGLQFGNAMQQREERERLREAMGLTPQEMQQRQASPEELGRAQAETQALAAEDARMFGLGPQEQAAYAPQMPVEGQRVGLPRYQLAGQTYDRAPTQQEIQQARYGAMADVIAERDPARALEMRQRLDEQKYQAERRPLELESLKGTIAGQGQQRELTGIQLGSAKRTEAEQLNASNFSAFVAENPNATTAELKDAAFKQFKFTPKQWQEAVNTRLGISDTEQKLFVSGVKDKLKGKNLQQLGSLYNSDPDFDDKTDLAIVPGKNGAVTLNFIDKATNKITSSQSFNNEALATEYLNKQATEPETIGSWMLALQKNQAAIDASKASASRDRAIGSAGGKGGLKQKVADFKEVYGRDPTEAEKGVLAGLTNKPREYTAADVNARAKLMIDGGMADPDDPTKPLSPQRAIQIATSELSGVPYVSPVDQLIKDIADARNAKAGTPPAAGAPAATPAAAPAPRGPASLGPDPSRPQPGVSPVTGLSRETPVQAPNVVAAVGRGLDAGQERYKVYLETKIANKQPLTADEKLRAKRLGLQ